MFSSNCIWNEITREKNGCVVQKATNNFVCFDAINEFHQWRRRHINRRINSIIIYVNRFYYHCFKTNIVKNKNEAPWTMSHQKSIRILRLMMLCCGNFLLLKAYWNRNPYFFDVFDGFVFFFSLLLGWMRAMNVSGAI